LSVGEGELQMSDVTAIDTDKRDRETRGGANGDNTIPRGDEERIIENVADHMAAIMGELNLDLEDPNYQQTPERVAKMYLEMFHGLREGAEPKITTFPNEEGYHHMVIEREIPFESSSSTPNGPSSRSVSRSRWPSSCGPSCSRRV
jgi:hypothetical protein